jgi:hypothetical protein
MFLAKAAFIWAAVFGTARMNIFTAYSHKNRKAVSQNDESFGLSGYEQSSFARLN